MHILRTKIFRVGLAAATFFIVAAAAYFLLNLEPSYEGRPLSYWLDQLPYTFVEPNGDYGRAYPQSYGTKTEAQAASTRLAAMRQRAMRAVHTNGTNSLPMLLARLRSKDSRFKVTVRQWALRLGLLDPSRIRTAEVRRGQALTAIVELDYRARSILPQLSALAKDRDPGVRAAALHALETIIPRKFIGIGMGIEADADTKRMKVIKVFPNSPASRAGLSTGLIILTIDGVTTEGKTLEECLRLLRGALGTRVRLELLNSTQNKTNTVELTREELES